MEMRPFKLLENERMCLAMQSWHRRHYLKLRTPESINEIVNKRIGSAHFVNVDLPNKLNSIPAGKSAEDYIQVKKGEKFNKNDFLFKKLPVIFADLNDSGPSVPDLKPEDLVKHLDRDLRIAVIDSYRQDKFDVVPDEFLNFLKVNSNTPLNHLNIEMTAYPSRAV